MPWAGPVHHPHPHQGMPQEHEFRLAKSGSRMWMPADTVKASLLMMSELTNQSPPCPHRSNKPQRFHPQIKLAANPRIRSRIRHLRLGQARRGPVRGACALGDAKTQKDRGEIMLQPVRHSTEPWRPEIWRIANASLSATPVSDDLI